MEMNPFGTIKKWLKKFKYTTVAIRHYEIYWTNNNIKTGEVSIVSYVCKVNGFGKRKVVIHTTDKVRREGYHIDNDYWHKCILPWVENDLEKYGNNEQTEDEGSETQSNIEKKDNIIFLNKTEKDVVDTDDTDDEGPRG